ncbi:hypothetical protein [Acinetobacter tjernbergiae]|uniref:Uncharacterized protein n=1 Tax=Acinetobacter tjernbergiae DSM 14971 = CIP 107465 TaxID=1120928 RepID=V2UMS1_9GAMM|nr:hypothetical protein [Acinetobacter tjernbergiae]ESK56023.1 hypothetical protein F990_01455 [Acinetobacter tjernbergiae DSM 14971 = CIP 107465]
MLKWLVFLIVPFIGPGFLYGFLLELSKIFNETDQRVVVLIIMYIGVAFIIATVTYENNPNKNKLKPVIIMLSLGALFFLFIFKTIFAFIYLIASILIVLRWHRKFKDK